MYTTMTVKQILDRKGNQVWSITPGDSVFDALRYMAEKNVGALLVIEDEKIVGIFSERDYARKLVLKGKDERNTQVSEVMTKQVIGVGPDRKIDECLALMTGKFIRHLPVVDDDQQVVGVVSIGDLVKELISEQAFIIDNLLQYISGETTRPPLTEKSDIVMNS